ncbi:paraquat-inducible protein A [Brucella sp. 22210]|uniref:paraquat-inducible protein A n=1 Tax=Brucella sp. 22210 TaxID=3453892 RepID=UPI003F840FEA
MCARCTRCNATLEHYRSYSLRHAYAYGCVGAICFIMANFLPFIKLEIGGRAQEASLVTGIISLYDQGQWLLSLVVAFTMLIAPGIKLLSQLAALTSLHMRPPAVWLIALHSHASLVNRWAMIEVYMLGLIVAYVKLIDLASVELGTGVFALVALMLATVACDALADHESILRHLERHKALAKRDESQAHQSETPPGNDNCKAAAFSNAPPLALQHRRKHNSLTRSWALVITAAILYIPANLMPVMTITSLGASEAETILSGIISLADSGMWPLAILVFFASILVPMLKLCGLILLLVPTQRGLAWRLRERTALYRLIEFLGRWSMIDIFVLSILAALVQLGQIATIEPGTGAVAFAAVVIITMIASQTFDPRLMWDVATPPYGKTID